MRLYFAAPLFTTGERMFNKALADALTGLGHEVWLPQEHEPATFGSRSNVTQRIFETDVAGIDQCEAVIANLDGPDPDSGTAWELGYAYAKGKPCFTYWTDFRRSSMDTGDEGCPVNIMLWESSHPVRSPQALDLETIDPETPVVRIIATQINSALHFWSNHYPGTRWGARRLFPAVEGAQ